MFDQRKDAIEWFQGEYVFSGRDWYTGEYWRVTLPETIQYYKQLEVARLKREKYQSLLNFSSRGDFF